VCQELFEFLRTSFSYVVETSYLGAESKLVCESKISYFQKSAMSGGLPGGKLVLQRMHDQKKVRQCVCGKLNSLAA
jgi:predicted Rdx family selenoprotein